MSNTNNGGPAFPNPGLANEACQFQSDVTGMTLRDYFAAKAMQGICAHQDTWGLIESEIAIRSYSLADAMLKAREVQS